MVGLGVAKLEWSLRAGARLVDGIVEHRHLRAAAATSVDRIVGYRFVYCILPADGLPVDRESFALGRPSSPAYN